MGAFSDWAEGWMACARYRGRDVPDPDRRIDEVLARWDAPVPGGWKRGDDARVLVSGRRYCRTHPGGARVPRGEHVIEHEILDPDPTSLPTMCLGARLVDGVNAVALAKDEAGGRRGNVEADMLLLTRAEDGAPRQLLVEVKVTSGTAWYAAVENLRQLRLFVESESAQRIFRARGADVPAATPVAALILAPPAYFAANGAKKAAVPPTRRLLDRFTAHTGLDAVLATWDLPGRTISAL
jgi:hypothetical protein